LPTPIQEPSNLPIGVINKNVIKKVGIEVIKIRAKYQNIRPNDVPIPNCYRMITPKKFGKT